MRGGQKVQRKKLNRVRDRIRSVQELMDEDGLTWEQARKKYLDQLGEAYGWKKSD